MYVFIGQVRRCGSKPATTAASSPTASARSVSIRRRSCGPSPQLGRGPKSLRSFWEVRAPASRASGQPGGKGARFLYRRAQAWIGLGDAEAEREDLAALRGLGVACEDLERSLPPAERRTRVVRSAEDF